MEPPEPQEAASGETVAEKPVVDGEKSDAKPDESEEKPDVHRNTEEALLARILELQRQRDEGVWDKAWRPPSKERKRRVCAGIF